MSCLRPFLLRYPPILSNNCLKLLRLGLEPKRKSPQAGSTKSLLRRYLGARNDLCPALDFCCQQISQSCRCAGGWGMGDGSMFSSSKRLATSGAFSAASTSRFSRAIVSLGVFAGAANAFHEETLKPVKPLCAAVGTSLSTTERLSPNTASARTAPALICGSMGLRISTAASICPPRKAVMTAGVPLKGTTYASIAAAVLNSSADRFCVLPILMLPMLSLRGLARAKAISSASDL